MALLSVRRGLTVWCRSSVIWWWAPDGRREQRVPTDLVDIAEQVVSICADMDRGAGSRGSTAWTAPAELPGPLSYPAR
jgi:hypothetical protein